MTLNPIIRKHNHSSSSNRIETEDRSDVEIEIAIEIVHLSLSFLGSALQGGSRQLQHKDSCDQSGVNTIASLPGFHPLLHWRIPASFSNFESKFLKRQCCFNFQTYKRYNEPWDNQRSDPCHRFMELNSCIYG